MKRLENSPNAMMRFDAKTLVCCGLLLLCTACQSTGGMPWFSSLSKSSESEVPQPYGAAIVPPTAQPPASSASASLTDQTRPQSSAVAQVSYDQPLPAVESLPPVQQVASLTGIGRRRTNLYGGCQACQQGTCVPGQCGMDYPCVPMDYPRPSDEYICDGGDRQPEARVGDQWQVKGLDSEDTIAHFDTLDGRTEVVPSNKVCIYAPRFAAVRRVDGLALHEQNKKLAGVENPVRIQRQDDIQIAGTAIQQLMPTRNQGLRALNIFRERNHSGGLNNLDAVALTEMSLLPYADLAIVKRGEFDNAEKARLSESLAAAVAWTDNQAVQVVIDNITASLESNVTRTESVFTYDIGGKPRLRICKLASRSDALPGEEVEFTLRFDNVGDQVIGNVTLMDHLTTRLEYVEGSQESTLKANFAAVDNESQSQTLRWEIVEPLKVGEGGVIKFKTRVR